MMKRGKNKKLFGEFYFTVYKGDQEIKTPYLWAEGEKDEYLKVCELADGWGGIPLDVAWAKSTTVYKEAFKKLLP